MSKATEKEKEETAVATTEAKNDLIPGTIPGLDAFAEFKQRGPIVGLEEVDASDIKMPKVKLCQSTSSEVGDEKCNAGQFYNVSTDQAMDTIKCRLLAIGKSRVMWPEKFKRGDQPLCRSFDGVEGTTEDGDIKSCSQCDDCKWEGNEKPACRQVYVWLGVLENGSPFRISMSGSAVSKTKDLLTMMTQKGLPPFVYEMTIGSEKQKNESGTYFIPTYEITGVIPKKDYKGLEDMSKSLQEMFITARKKDILDAGAIIEGEAGEGKGIF